MLKSTRLLYAAVVGRKTSFTALIPRTTLQFFNDVRNYRLIDFIQC